MKRDRLPIDDLNNADRALGLVILAGAFSVGLWCAVHLIRWILGG
jgi:hypothetical protein